MRSNCKSHFEKMKMEKIELSAIHKQLKLLVQAGKIDDSLLRRHMFNFDLTLRRKIRVTPIKMSFIEFKQFLFLIITTEELCAASS